ncbi:hypothetical protein DMX05_18780 [Pseudomonas soli]|nr:hypothetical protein C3F42_04385 [Pseudomonas sp. PONIH3]PYC37506.1 hypothetical protein DMX05_18780 [Pseudomonas soli]
MVRSSVRAVLAAGRDQVDQIKMTMLVGDEAYQEESDGRDMLCKRSTDVGSGAGSHTPVQG